MFRNATEVMTSSSCRQVAFCSQDNIDRTGALPLMKFPIYQETTTKKIEKWGKTYELIEMIAACWVEAIDFERPSLAIINYDFKNLLC